MNHDAKYEEYLENVMRIEHPYEYALLKSDLKENLLRLEERRQNNNGPQTYRILDSGLVHRIKYMY